MNKRMIFFLMKIFEKEEYANDFLKGKMFANPLSYFKEMEDEDGRGDEYEGIIMPHLDGLIMTLRSKNMVTGEVKSHTINKEEFAAPRRLLVCCPISSPMNGLMMARGVEDLRICISRNIVGRLTTSSFLSGILYRIMRRLWPKQ